MPTYKYKAAALSGRAVNGRREAADESKLRAALRDEQLFLVNCTEVNEKHSSKQLTSAELIDFCRQTGSMLSAGLTLTTVLGIMLKEEMSDNMQLAVKSVYRSIKLGAPLSEAMAYTGGAFPKAACRMIAAAEENGTVPDACIRLAEHYEKDEKSRYGFKSRLAFPLALLGLLVLLLFAALIFVIPVFAEIYGGEELPPFTAFLRRLNVFLTDKWLYALLIIGALAAVIRLTLAIPSVEMYISKRLVTMKRAGRLFRVIYTSRFCRTFSAMYSGGLSVISACAAAGEDIGSVYMEKQVDEAIKAMRRGSTVRAAFESADGFDGRLRSAVLAGEESGKLGEMLSAAAEALEQESERAVKQLSEFAERVIFGSAAFLTLLIFAVIMLPVYELYLAI
ncbi:MAG: type II secretion system F family protein [Huintestinicola sp.]|uniref:type II secretion system F family protein n=1 Tax=Huintestinicola sp. TaxID=2981661 RepID=UPI003F1216AA